MAGVTLDTIGGGALAANAALDSRRWHAPVAERDDLPLFAEDARDVAKVRACANRRTEA